MLKLGRWEEQIKLLHLVPHFHSNLSRHTKKTPMMQVFGGTWGKNSKYVPCTAHHLLPLPIWVDGSKRRLSAMQKRTAWGRLHVEVESVIFFKPIWSDGCETLFSQLNAQSKVNGGTVPNNAVHQMFLYLRVILVSIEKAIQGSNKMAGQFNISPAHCWVIPYGRSLSAWLHKLFLRLFLCGVARWMTINIRIACCCGLLNWPQPLVELVCLAHWIR